MYLLLQEEAFDVYSEVTKRVPAARYVHCSPGNIISI